MQVTQPRILNATKGLGVSLSPTTTPRLWAANLNGTVLQFLTLPSQVVLRADIEPTTLDKCNEVCASPLLVSAALIDAPSPATRVEYNFPTAAGLSDAQLEHLIRTGIDHILLAKKQLLEPSQ